MSKTFAIADLHGRHDLLLMALERIEAANPNGGTIVFTGDYVDRGFESRQIIETLMAGPTDPKIWKWVCLQGNHELIMIAGCREGELRWWLKNGGDATLLSYGQKQGEYADVKVVPKEHLDWVQSLPITYRDRYRLFVHAFIDPTKSFEDQSDEDMQWKLYPAGLEDGHGEHHVVHGHHAHEYGPLLLKGRSNFDTQAFAIGRLVVGVFDNAVPGGPIATIEVQGPTIQELWEIVKATA